MCNTVRHSQGEVKRAFLGVPPKGFECTYLHMAGVRAQAVPTVWRISPTATGVIPVMTITVYEVGRDGLTLIVREEAEVVPLEQPESSHQFPAFECPGCQTP